MNLSPRDSDTPIPLTPQAFHVLLALAHHQDTGYGIIKTVAQDSAGIIHLQAGTIYPLLKRLTRFGYIQNIATHSGSGPRGEVKVYRLSSTGLMVLDWEADRYHTAAILGQSRLKAHHTQAHHNHVQ